MSDFEDFVLQINPEELFPERLQTPKRKKINVTKEKTKISRKKKKRMKLIRPAPNHFIAFRIFDSELCQRVTDFQNRLIKISPLLMKSLINVNTLHVSLAITHLENQEKKEELIEKLKDWGENKVKEHFKKPINLTFKGIGTFDKGVVYVKVNQCENYERLCNLSKSVNDLLHESGFIAEKKKAFVPHLTLLKLSRDWKMLRKYNQLFKRDFVELEKCNDYFGCQDVKDLQLLSMLGMKDDGGYYKSLWKINTNELCAGEKGKD